MYPRWLAKALINVVAMVLTIVALGLTGAGSVLAVPVFIAAFAGWSLADRVSVDVEFLGGLVILAIGGALAYVLLRPLFLLLF